MSLGDDLAKAFGGSAMAAGPTCWLSTGFPPLDNAICGRYHDGGLPGGCMIEVFGPSSAGKTVIATNVMIQTQRAGGFALFNDHERTLQEKLSQSMGLSLDKDQWMYRRPRSFEESVTDAVKIAKFIRDKKVISPKAPITIVFDSLASMVPKSKLDKDATDFNMNDNTALARATSAALPALAQHCEDLNILMLFLNQVRTKIGVMFGDPTTTPGGQAPEFYMTVRIQLSRAQISEGEGKDKEITGQVINATVRKNKVHRPFEKASWRFMFQEDGTGMLDTVTSGIEHLLEIGALEKDANRVVWIDGKKLYVKELAKKIRAEGLYPQLVALYPGAPGAPGSATALPTAA